MLWWWTSLALAAPLDPDDFIALGTFDPTATRHGARSAVAPVDCGRPDCGHPPRAPHGRGSPYSVPAGYTVRSCPAYQISNLIPSPHDVFYL